MDPAHVVTGTGESPAGLYSLLGLLFLVACVLLLIHCASSSRRKKRRQVDNRDVSGEGGGQIDVNSGQDVNGKGPTKARESQRAQPPRKTSPSKKFPSVTIIITPPSPVTDSRSENNGSSDASDDDDRTRNSTTANGRAQNDVTTTKHDVTRSHEDAVENGSKVGASTTSLSGIADVNFVTTDEGVSERGEDSPPKPWTAAPKLSSPDSDSPKSDYCTVVGTKSHVVKL